MNLVQYLLLTIVLYYVIVLLRKSSNSILQQKDVIIVAGNGPKDLGEAQANVDEARQKANQTVQSGADPEEIIAAASDLSAAEDAREKFL